MFKQKQLRDVLAIDRTNLAIDRTLLSYLRTSLTLAVLGLSLVKLFDVPLLSIVGWIQVIAAPILFVVGKVKCDRLRNKYHLRNVISEA